MQRNDWLRQHRVVRNWRQQDVADQLGITVLTVQRWERGTQQPSAYYRIKLSTLFGVSAQDLGLIEAPPLSLSAESEAQEAALATPGAALWMVPYTRNLHFTGRNEILDRIEQMFQPSETDQLTTLHQAALTQSQAIKGLGGIGKTQIAVEYAYRAREQGHYTHTFWISAASEEAILASFAAMAELLPAAGLHTETDQRKLVTEVVRWLQHCRQRWLLIVDNADDLSMVQPYLPQTGNGCLLLTTRASATGLFASSIEVETMGLIEGTQLLLRRALRVAEASDEEINEASNIVTALGFFPLALDQAGAYIEETGCNLQDYLHIYEQRRHVLLARRGRQTMGYPDSVAATWSLSFQYIEQTNPAATELLRLLAFVAPDQIPEELLTEGAPYWPQTLREAVADRLDFNQMLEALRAFSLVKRMSEDRSLSIHRLVQVVQMERLTPQEQRQWAKQLVRAVHAVFPRDPANEAETWPQCLRLLEQVQVCDTLIQQYQLLLPEAAEILDRAGVYLNERALYTLAEPLFQRALQIIEKQKEAQPEQLVTVLNHLAHIFLEQSKFAETETLHLRALQICEQQLGAEHPLAATSLNHLANLYEQQGKYVQAEDFYLRALHIREQQLGPEHIQVATTLRGLAILRTNQGLYKEAEAFYLRALHIQETHLEPEHHQIALTINSLAFIYAYQEEFARAETLYRRTLAVQEKLLGPDHPQIAYPLLGLAFIYWQQKQYAQSEMFYLQALHIREQHLGPEHILMTYVQHGLALLYSDQGRYAEAEALFQRALLLRRQQIGPESTMTSDSLRGLANLYTYQQRYTEAEPLFLQALQIRERHFGPDNPETAQVLHDLAGFQQAQGHNVEAAALYQRALTIRENMTGFDHPTTLDTREKLRALLAASDAVAPEAAQQEPEAT